jgi:6-pyruvoyl-tetrahydropterin synthase
MERFDHRDLNDDGDYFRRVPPTPEHFARLIYRLLDDALPEGMLDRIRLHQSADLYVEVIGPEA